MSNSNVTFHKVIFYSPKVGRTAGLIFKSDALEGKSTAEISRLFPYSEFRKMERLYVSQGFDSFDAAFNFQPNLGVDYE